MQDSIACLPVSCTALSFTKAPPLFILKREDTGVRMEHDNSFAVRVWQIVAAIPEGYVTTYGEVAQLAGSPRAARQVGGVLKRLPEGSTLPWHRVVNRHGTISLTGPDLQRQRQALLAEGIQVSGKGLIDMQRYRWRY
jgi:methylated-DNA-protein-cysteine methyltransferase-like protein